MIGTAILFLFLLAFVLADGNDASVRVMSVDYKLLSKDLAKVPKDLGSIPVDVVAFLNYPGDNTLTDALQAHGFKVYNIQENKLLLASVQPLEKHAAVGYVYTAADKTRALLYGMTGTETELTLHEKAVANAGSTFIPGGPKYIFFEPSKIRFHEKSMTRVEEKTFELAGVRCQWIKFDLRGRRAKGFASLIKDNYWILLLIVAVCLGIVIGIIVY